MQGYFYYIFGFCFVVGMLTVLITVEVAIVCTYVQLCAEDYLWWYAATHCTTPSACLRQCLPAASCRTLNMDTQGCSSKQYLRRACPVLSHPRHGSRRSISVFSCLLHKMRSFGPARPPDWGTAVCDLSAAVHCRWRSFHRGGSMALYMGLYSVGFLVNTLHSLSGLVSVVLYLSYMGLVLWAIYLAMGTVGFFASFLFTYKIFGAVKAD